MKIPVLRARISKRAFLACGACLVLIATCWPPAAGRTSTKPQSHVIELRGTRVEGGVAGRFIELVDLDTGYNSLAVQSGVSHARSGFDGMPWAWTNGTVLRNTLPIAVQLAHTRAFIARLGWTRGQSDPNATIQYGPDKRPQTITIAADFGPETITLSQWHTARGIPYPFVQEDVDASGERTVLRISQLRRVTPGANAFHPPPPVNHGFITGVMPEVPFTFSGAHDPHIVVNALIDGHDARLIFDTGGANYFGIEAARSWGLNVSGGTNLSGAGPGSISAGFARAKSIRLGGVELRDQLAVVAPLPWPRSPTSPDGLTGAEFFTQFRTTIDYQHRTLSFANFDTPNIANGVTLPFYTYDFHMFVTAMVNGVPGVFGIDTGDAVAVTLFKPFAERIGIASKAGSADSTGGAVGGTVRLSKVPLASFAIAGKTLPNINAELATTETGAFASKSVAGNLGGALFRCFALTIDFHVHTITFTDEPDTADCLKALAAH